MNEQTRPDAGRLGQKARRITITAAVVVGLLIASVALLALVYVLMVLIWRLGGGAE